MIYIAGCISHLPIIVAVNMDTKCLRTDCSICEKKKKNYAIMWKNMVEPGGPQKIIQGVS
jgi:hypothetical protein